MKLLALLLLCQYQTFDVGLFHLTCRHQKVKPVAESKLDIAETISSEETSRHNLSFEPQIVDSKAEVLPAITEGEIQLLAKWLNEAESLQAYERLQNDDLHYAESASGHDSTLEIEKAATLDFSEIIEDNETSASSEVEVNLSVDVAVEVAELQKETQVQEVESYGESLDISIEADELISNIEDLYDSPEQEIIGELLIDILTADVKSASLKDAIVEPSPSGLEDITELMYVQTEDILSPFDKFTAYLETIEPDIREQATELVSSISELVKELKSAENITPEDEAGLTIELELAIHELFATLGIELGAKQSHKFIELLLLNLDNNVPVSRTYNIDYLNRMGTREYKSSIASSLLGSLLLTNSSQLKSIELVGKYTIQACLA